MNAPPPHTHTHTHSSHTHNLDIDDSGGNNSCSLSDVAKRSRIVDKNTPPRNFENSTTYPMGASLSDILFPFVLEKYIVCDVCGLKSPSFDSSTVLYISPTDTSSMQNLILQGLQQKLQKSCSRCKQEHLARRIKLYIKTS